MNMEKMGKITIEKESINLDEASVEELDSIFIKLDNRKDVLMDGINKLLVKIQE